MPIRIFHKDHGYVLTSDQSEIDMLLSKGGIIDKQKDETSKPEINVKPLPPKRKTYGSR